MNDENKIKLQAYLDGELSGRDEREISELLTTDNEAQSLLAELQMVKSALHGNELELKLPETREFYWSKIQREIERTEQQPASKSNSWWKPVYARFAGGLAAACGVLAISFIAFNTGPTNYATGEVEGSGDEMGVITFRSDAERMTVVYLFDRDADDIVDSSAD